MDTKTSRRNFYHNKVYLSNKFDQQYTTEKFPEELQLVLDQYIPKATLNQLTKFMNKKYRRIIKLFPKVQKTLNKVIFDKVAQLPQELKQNQIQKLLLHLQEQYPNYHFQLQGNGNYKMLPNEKSVMMGVKHYFWFQNLKIRVPKNPNFYIHIQLSKKDINGNRFYTVIHHNPEHRYERYFASTENIQGKDYRMNGKNGNFERNVNKLLDKFNQYELRMNSIENSQMQE